jgi:hypothetical protein
MASADANIGGKFGLISGSPHISHAVIAGWLRNVHLGQGKRPFAITGGVGARRKGNWEGVKCGWRGDSGLSVPAGGGIPQFRHGGIGDVGEKLEGYGFEKVQ